MADGFWPGVVLEGARFYLHNLELAEWGGLLRGLFFMLKGVLMGNKLIMLANQREISRIFDNGGSKVNRLFVLRFVDNTTLVPRFVFAVGKKYGNAVARNRLKRRLREILRHNLDIIPNGLDYAIIPRRGVSVSTYQVLEDALNELFGKVGRERVE